MKLIVAVNSNGTHTWMGYFHDRDWDVQEYREEVYSAMKKTFRRLKPKNIDPITITEVEDVESGTGQKKQASKTGGNALQRGRALAEREELIQTVSDAYLPRN